MLVIALCSMGVSWCLSIEIPSVHPSGRPFMGMQGREVEAEQAEQGCK